MRRNPSVGPFLGLVVSEGVWVDYDLDRKETGFARSRENEMLPLTGPRLASIGER